MSATVIGLALLAAILHASWNAFLRTGADRLWTVTVMSFSSTVVAIPLAISSAFPAPHAWPYVVLSACLQVGYTMFLVAAYRNGELGQVYPIVRGSVPLLVTLGGFLLANQHLAIPQILGVGLVAGGIMSLALGKGRTDITSILHSLAAGAIIAAYATVDAIGVRQAGSATAYTAWVLLIYGALLPAAFIAFRG
ncbi:MAG: EamA family transporter, partial [Mesorhizobium sp.]